MFDKDAEEIANKKLCATTMCYNHCNFNSPKHHRCGEWHRIYECVKESAEFGYNEALKEVDDICTEEAIYHARLEELFDRINWDGPEVKESEDEKLLKAIKDYAAHGHKDDTPFDVALCIEKAIDNAEDSKWHTPEEEPVPSGKYAEEDFPQIPCLVQFKYNDYGVRYWNVTYKCWDDEDCDDYYCDMSKVKRWAYIREE